MPERVPSDHPSVTTHRGRVARSGGTRRPCLRLPGELDLADGEFVRLSLEGDRYHARVVVDGEGPLVRGAFDNRRLAREPGAGENRLAAWLADREPGEAVAVDAVEPGALYGVRDPGRRVVYEAVEGPEESLASIARELTEE